MIWNNFPLVKRLVLLIPFIVLRANILTFLLKSFYTYDVINDQVKATRDVEQIFDYIVVGGGSAGSVLSSRLSEDPGVKVLLLEAGGDPNPLHSIPIMALPMLNHPYIDWRFFSEPQTNSCLSMNNNSSAWPRGKSLGGSSNLGFMVYARGFPRDYDEWARLTGDERWAYKNILPWFKKSENFNGRGSMEMYHGHGGPLNVAEPPYKKMSDIFIKAGQEFGFSQGDPAGEVNQRVKVIASDYYTQKSGHRQSAYKAFVKPVKNRANLFIYKFAHVTKILLEGEENRAVGVSYVRHGQNKIAFASREVIISAGAVNTPQILMLSGIGPKDQLNSFEIPVRADLPVGLNLQDHVGSLIGPFIIDAPLSMRLERDITVKTVSEFFLRGTGPVTSTTVHANSFFASKLAIERNQQDWPDLQHEFISSAISSGHSLDLTRVFNLRPGILNEHFKEAMNQDSFLVVNILNRPKSKGQIQLRSTNPLDPVRINPNYFSEEEDISILVEGAKTAVELIEGSKTFKKIGGHLTSIPFPPCAHLPFKGDEYWQCYHRQYTLTFWHPCCTAPMGKMGDPSSVVDSQLRVIGTKNLRVVDASIMPIIVSGNLNAPTIMIGEMGAQFIKMAAEGVTVQNKSDINLNNLNFSNWSQINDV